MHPPHPAPGRTQEVSLPFEKTITGNPSRPTMDTRCRVRRPPRAGNLFPNRRRLPTPSATRACRNHPALRRMPHENRLRRVRRNHRRHRDLCRKKLQKWTSAMMNETHKCVICQRFSEHMACGKCESIMRRQLSEILEFAALAESNLEPGSGPRQGARSSSRPLGIRLDALDFVAGFDVLPVLESWERLFREDYNLGKYGQISHERNAVVRYTMPAHDGRSIPPQIAINGYLSGTIGFLSTWLPRICENHPAIDEFSAEIRACWQQAQTAAGQTPRTTWTVKCPADTGQTAQTVTECGHNVCVSGQDFDGVVTCRKCKTTWEVQRLLLVAASSSQAEIWVDAEAAAAHYQLHQRTLQRMAKTGAIQRKNGKYLITHHTQHTSA